MNLFRRLQLAGIPLFLFVAFKAGVAQGITGNVLLPNGDFLNEPARIILQTDRGVKSYIYTDNRGHFQFFGLSPNVYDIVVIPDGDRFEQAKVTVEVYPGPSIINVDINLKERKRSNSPANAVSVGELDPAVPAQAKKEFEVATATGKSGKTDEAIAHLRKAIAIYPKFLMAHNDLGSQLLGQGKLAEAEQEFRQAIRLDDRAFNPRLNLGIVLVQQHKAAEAVETLKIAQSLQPNSPAASLYLGLALGDVNDVAGAERQFKAAYDIGGSAYVVALYYLGQIYMNSGNRENARKAFETYVRSAPNGPYAAEAKRMIGILN